MSIAVWIYSILGLGGVSALIWAVISIKDWGAADIKKKVAMNDAKNADETTKAAIHVAQKYADSRNKPAHIRLRDLAKTKPRRGPGL